MLHPRSLIERRDDVVESCRRRHMDVNVDDAIALHERVTSAQQQIDDVRRQRNEHQAAGKRKLSPEERQAHVAEGRRLKEQVAQQEQALTAARAQFDTVLATIPNFLHPEVPEGGEDEGRELKRVGQPPVFDFDAKDHLGVAAGLDGIDFESGAKVAGKKFYFLKNDLVLLELALQRFALDALLGEGFTPFVTPDLARADIVAGLGFNPRGDETQIYSVANTDLCLIGTAEIPLGGMHADTILDEASLPLRYAGISHCFRTEAGAHGRESKGLYRVHQFTKVEMFAFTKPEDSDGMHDELLRIEESLYQRLELPYRVLDVAAGDLGAPAYRKFDIEAWMPGRGEGGQWGEVTSTSNCTDYQARRLRVRFRRTETKKNDYVHMLNGTAIANSRAVVALLENHQRADGTVHVPRELQPYVGREVLQPPAPRNAGD